MNINSLLILHIQQTWNNPKFLQYLSHIHINIQNIQLKQLHTSHLTSYHPFFSDTHLIYPHHNPTNYINIQLQQTTFSFIYNLITQLNSSNHNPTIFNYHSWTWSSSIFFRVQSSYHIMSSSIYTSSIHLVIIFLNIIQPNPLTSTQCTFSSPLTSPLYSPPLIFPLYSLISSQNCLSSSLPLLW